MGYSEDLAIEKRPKMRCNWASKSPSYFLPVPYFHLPPNPFGQGLSAASDAVQASSPGRAPGAESAMVSPRKFSSRWKVR